MSYIEAIIMGFIQGLTEFLPVSSSGHLALSRHILGLELDNILFEVLLHFGTLIAIIAVYFKDVVNLVVEGVGIIFSFFKYLILKGLSLFDHNIKMNKIINSSYRKFVMLIIVATIPTAIIGFLFEATVEKMYNSLIVPGISLVITGLLLFTTNKLKSGYKKQDTMPMRDAIILGVFQGFAVLPGISRSGSTIVAGLLRGLNKEFAVKFSFLMSLPAVFGAMLLQFKDIPLADISTVITPQYIVGTIISAVVGYICIKALIAMVQKNKFHYFAYYCWIVGIATIITYFIAG